MQAIGSIGDPILSEIVKRLVGALEPERIYLFGSTARGDAGPDSDYDLMVVVGRSDEPSYRRSQNAHSLLWASPGGRTSWCGLARSSTREPI